MKLFIMTSQIQTGKTTWIRRMLQTCGRLPESDRTPFGLQPRSEESNVPLLHVAGSYSPAVFSGDVKTAIDAVLLPQGERFRFAPRRSEAELAEMRAQGLPPRVWDFQDAALARINAHYASEACRSCDLLLVDEVGWLEFEHDAGYTEALRLLDAAVVPSALIVVRRDLLHHAYERWEDVAEIAELTPKSDISEFLLQATIPK